MGDWITDLERLKALRSADGITETEFETAKACVLSRAGQTPEPASASAPPAPAGPVANSIEQPDAEHSEDSTTFGGRSSLWKRVLIGVAVIGPIFLLATLGFGQLESFLTGEAVPSRMVANCIGIGTAGATERMLNQPVSVFIEGLKQQGLKAVALEQANDNGLILRVEDDDPAKTVREQGAYYMRRVSGNGGLSSCGPDTLSVERVLANDHDLGSAGMQGVIFTIMRGMQALGIKPQNAATARNGNGPATTPSSQSSAAGGRSVGGGLIDGTGDQSSNTLSDEELAETRGAVHLIVGLWAPQGEYCASGASIRISPGGKWQTEDGGGSWRFENDTLSLKDKAGKLGDAVTNWTDADEFTAHWQDGTKSRWRRCPAEGSSEPWFPA